MSSSPDRGVVTDWLENILTVNGFQASGFEPPSDAGWQEGLFTSGSVFSPYIVLTPQSSGPSEDASYGDPSRTWDLVYTVNVYGIVGRQVEDVADDARRVLLALRRLIIEMRSGDEWKLLNVSCTSIGGVSLNQDINPHAYSQTDSFAVKISKETR